MHLQRKQMVETSILVELLHCNKKPSGAVIERRDVAFCSNVAPVLLQRWRRRPTRHWSTSAAGLWLGSWPRWPLSLPTWSRPTSRSDRRTGARRTPSATSTRCVCVQSASRVVFPVCGRKRLHFKSHMVLRSSVLPSGARPGRVFQRRRPQVSAAHPDGRHGLDSLRAADGSNGPQILRSHRVNCKQTKGVPSLESSTRNFKRLRLTVMRGKRGERLPGSACVLSFVPFSVLLNLGCRAECRRYEI